MDKSVDFICWFSFDRGGPGFESFVWKLKKLRFKFLINSRFGFFLSLSLSPSFSLWRGEGEGGGSVYLCLCIRALRGYT